MTDSPTLSELMDKYSTLCPRHGHDTFLTINQRSKFPFKTKSEAAAYWREVDECQGCCRANDGTKFWWRLEEETEIEVGPRSLDTDKGLLRRCRSNRMAIQKILLQAHGYGLDMWAGPYRIPPPKGPGAPVRPEADAVIKGLEHIYGRAGGFVRVRLSNRQGAEPKEPFVRFLYEIWCELPASVRLTSELQFVRRAREVIQLRRNAFDGYLKPKNGDTLRLKVTAGVEIGGRAPGDVIEVPAVDESPWDPFWRKRLKDGSVAVV